MVRLLLPALLAALLSVANARTPNVVVILADDMGVGDVSHNGGKAATPHLDQLAREGMRFTDAHSASAVCTPTRYALVNGRYNWRSPLKKGVLGGPSPTLIRNGETTLAAFLGKHGYRSMVIGKWHLGLDWAKLPQKGQAAEGPTKGAGWDIDFTQKAANGPTALGFSEDFLFPASLDMAPYVYLRNDEAIDQPTVSATFWSNRWGPAVKGMKAEQCLGDFAREARAFIGRNAGKPFFLYLPLTSPHTPIAPSERFRGKSPIGPYGDFIMETDWVVGEVLAELDARGIADDTLLFFTTDNGCSPQAGFDELATHDHHPSGKFRGHKADIYEGGHRVPFLVRWPGKVAAGTTTPPRPTRFPCCRPSPARRRTPARPPCTTRSTAPSRCAKARGSCACARGREDGRNRGPKRPGKTRSCPASSSSTWPRIRAKRTTSRRRIPTWSPNSSMNS
jgi:arylsulfatase A-like enzyme